MPRAVGRPGVERCRRHARLLAAQRSLPDHHLHHHAAHRRLPADRRQRRTTRSKSGCCPDLVSGAAFATVGISHLTTSRRHLAKPVLRAPADGDGFMLDGFSPWVTGADHASIDRDRRRARRRPADSGGAADRSPRREDVPPPPRAGRTYRPATPARCSSTRSGSVREWLLAGPAENVMQFRRRRRHRRIANLDAGDRPGRRGDRLPGTRIGKASRCWPAPPPNCAASTPNLADDSAGSLPAA